MKHIKLFEELTLNRVLDLVIDKTGVLWDTKGYIDTKENKITDDRGNEYVAGIDKNGFLFTFEDTDDDWNIIYNGKPLIDPEDGSNWNTNEDYIDLISKTPTGWVNVKIDMEVIRKVKRYAVSLNKSSSTSAFDDKLKSLSNPSLLAKKCSTTEGIQKQMAAIMLLRYLSEIKDYFNPTSSGFLLESFLGGLIPGKVPDDNSEFDIEADDGHTYQIKFYDWNASYIPFNKNKACDYYIVALKKVDSIIIWRLTNVEGNKMFIDKFTTKGGAKTGPQISCAKLKNVIEESASKLDLSNIDDRIDKISSSLRQVVGDLWDEISELQYNVETLLTGVDKEHNIIDDENKHDKVYQNARENVKNLNTHLSRLKSSMSGE